MSIKAGWLVNPILPNNNAPESDEIEEKELSENMDVEEAVCLPNYIMQQLKNYIDPPKQTFFNIVQNLEPYRDIFSEFGNHHTKLSYYRLRFLFLVIYCIKIIDVNTAHYNDYYKFLTKEAKKTMDVVDITGVKKCQLMSNFIFWTLP